MRLALVSAHYPPNFVSGGTLVPHRLASRLAARGHEVRVFAGRLDADETPLTVQTTTDDDGIPVTWVNTTPWTGWHDPKNVDNPDVHERFRTFLDEYRPETVHFHSLQTLGASLVTAAKDAGCRTVLTMHDFWWLCARQFLVDREHRPCSLVVSAGTCACESGRQALDERAAVLAPHLGSADLILAPSQVTADVLEANGIDRRRLRVNENGMVDAVVHARPEERSDSDPVVLRYTGGPDPMKGAAVLRRAAELLDPDPGWRLVVHVDPAAAGPLRDLRTNGSVSTAPPYAPSELDEVFAATDVLVLPSVMRETHSIVTREALLRGVPVIASDSLGPEAVVRHGVNGLIVPTGDAHALAEAMRSVTDRSRLGSMRAAATSVVVRSVDEQVDELERYLTDPLPETDDAWSPRSVLFIVGIDGAPLRYRAQFPAEALGLVGVETEILHYSDPAVETSAEACDAVIVYRVPATPRILRVIDGVRRRGVPVAFDVDDLIVDPEVEHEIPALRILPDDEAALWREGVRRYRTTLEHCDVFVGSTEPLVERVGSATGLRAHLKQNAYGLAVARRSDDALREVREPGPVRIGYFSGTKTHDEDLRSIVPALIDVLDEHTETELWLGGLLPDVPELERFGARVRRLPLRPWNELPTVLRQLDVNLAPLADAGTFNQSKSAIKWLEAALVSTPTIASATRPFVDAVDDGTDGILVPVGGDWGPALRRLVADDGERARMGAAARRSALLRWSPHVQAARVIEILRDARSSPETDRVSTWDDVTVDEPAAGGPVPLTPYPADEHGDVEPPPAPEAPGGFAHKLWWSLRNESTSVVARRVLRRLRR